MPSSESIPLTDAVPEPTNAEKENNIDEMAFENSFNLPTPTKTIRKREVLRPPSVATSKEFKLFLEAKANQKAAIEDEKREKRKARELKKANKLAEKENKKRTSKNRRLKTTSKTVSKVMRN